MIVIIYFLYFYFCIFIFYFYFYFIIIVVSSNYDPPPLLIEKFPRRILILWKPLSDPGRLKNISNLNGFDAIYQLCCNNDLDLLNIPHNQTELTSMFSQLERFYGREIMAVEASIREKEEQAKKASKIALLLQDLD